MSGFSVRWMMNLDLLFFMNSLGLGFGLAMDAFSVSMANGLHEPNMSKGKGTKIAFTFGFFQFLMPMIGWVCVHTIVRYFVAFEKLIPWIALILLGYICGKMLWEGFHESGEETGLGSGALFVQGIATSIDALSVGFTISEYDLAAAFIASAVIFVVTFILCLFGVEAGKRFGMKLAGKATIAGGIILLLIGLEIFVKGVF